MQMFRQKVESALISMGREELQKLIEEEGKASVTCQFCDAVYDFSREDLVDLLKVQKK